MKKYLAVLFTLALIVSGVAYASGTNLFQGLIQGTVSQSTPSVELVNAQGVKIGTITLSQTNEGVQARVKVSNLPPGLHGFHVHEKAFEDANFKNAGGHYNPVGKKHGAQNPAGPHMGDLQNLEVQKDGTADTTFNISHMQIETLVGKSFIIHANADDYKTDPSGNSGDRIAGGNITR